MIATTAATAATAATTAAHLENMGHWGGPPLWPFFIFFPLLFIVILGLVFALVARRRFGASGPPSARGHWAPGGPGAGGPGAGARSAEQVLADRFARGDIDETEYRARLEVLRANRPEA